MLYILLSQAKISESKTTISANSSHWFSIMQKAPLSMRLPCIEMLCRTSLTLLIIHFGDDHILSFTHGNQITIGMHKKPRILSNRIPRLEPKLQQQHLTLQFLNPTLYSDRRFRSSSCIVDDFTSIGVWSPTFWAGFLRMLFRCFFRRKQGRSE